MNAFLCTHPRIRNIIVIRVSLRRNKNIPPLQRNKIKDYICNVI